MDQRTETQTPELPNPEKISIQDIKPKIPEVDGSLIVLQRHEKYVRDPESPKKGSLDEKAAEHAKELGRNTIKQILEGLPQVERDSVDIMVVASDTQYREGGRRSIETGEKTMEGVRDVLDELGLSKDRLLNDSDRFLSTGPIPVPDIREPKIFLDSPDFVKFMEEKYGTGLEFWIAYEDDVEKDARLKARAEGPIDMADRLASFMSLMARHAKAYHNANPGRRLIIWAVSHYDTISPYVKKYIANMSQNKPLAVDYGAGITIDIAKSGKANTTIGENNYDVPLGRPKII